MEAKLNDIYEFLRNNRAYNKELQTKYYKSVFSNLGDVRDRVISLLYSVANSQSQPRIDCLAEFYQFIYKDTDSLTSFNKFVKRVSDKDNGCYKDLFDGLKKYSGWGDKTSALFTKAVFQLRNDNYGKGLQLWQDTPQHIGDSDRLYLPVDAVIKEIFKKLGYNKLDFNTINNEINKTHPGAKIEVWDDLWFWGFISQRVVNGGKRKFEWNSNKYWALEHSNKDASVIDDIEAKSKCFLEILEGAITSQCT